MGNYAGTKVWRERKKQEDPEAFRAYRAEEARKRRAAHPEKIKTYRRKWRHENAERLKPIEAQQARERRKNNPEGQRLRNLAWHERKRKKQEQTAGRPRPDICEVCGEFHLRIVFDHNHMTETFRGWLCDRCNKTLGMVYDSATLLRDLAQYVETKREEHGKTNHKES